MVFRALYPFYCNSGGLVSKCLSVATHFVAHFDPLVLWRDSLSLFYLPSPTCLSCDTATHFTFSVFSVFRITYFPYFPYFRFPVLRIFRIFRFPVLRIFRIFRFRIWPNWRMFYLVSSGLPAAVALLKSGLKSGLISKALLVWLGLLPAATSLG